MDEFVVALAPGSGAAEGGRAGEAVVAVPPDPEIGVVPPGSLGGGVVGGGEVVGGGVVEGGSALPPLQLANTGAGKEIDVPTRGRNATPGGPLAMASRPESVAVTTSLPL